MAGYRRDMGKSGVRQSRVAALYLAAGLISALSAAPTARAADPAAEVSGPYINLGLGGTVLNRVNVDRLDLPALGVTSGQGGYGDAGAIGTRGGFVGSAAFGWGLGQGLRLEIEGDYRRNDLSTLGGLPASGTTEQAFGFANALWDFPGLGSHLVPGLSPYVGIGAGYEYVHLLNGNAVGDDGFGGQVNLRSTGSGGGFAAQAMLGLAYDITAIPGLSLTAEYRFTAAPESQSFNGQFSAAGLSTRATVSAGSFYNHAGLIGLRYAFFPGGAAPASPPPAPPPESPAAAPVRTYLVFFDWDRADLSPRARQIVAEAANNAGRVATTRIEVSGYTDLSGTAAYNKKLSLRRAGAVRDELVRDGLHPSDITIFGLGEQSPLVPTAPGGREPQNRRVEIVLK